MIIDIPDRLPPRGQSLDTTMSVTSQSMNHLVDGLTESTFPFRDRSVKSHEQNKIFHLGNNISILGILRLRVLLYCAFVLEKFVPNIDTNNLRYILNHVKITESTRLSDFAVDVSTNARRLISIYSQGPASAELKLCEQRTWKEFYHRYQSGAMQSELTKEPNQTAWTRIKAALANVQYWEIRMVDGQRCFRFESILKYGTERTAADKWLRETGSTSQTIRKYGKLGIITPQLIDTLHEEFHQLCLRSDYKKKRS